MKCLSELAELQQGGGGRSAAQLAHLAAAASSNERTRLKRESLAMKTGNDEKNKSTEMLLQEKEAEIKKMQEMLQAMQAKLQQQQLTQNSTQV